MSNYIDLEADWQSSFDTFLLLKDKKEFQEYLRTCERELQSKLEVGFEDIVEWLTEDYCGEPLYVEDDPCVERLFNYHFMIVNGTESSLEEGSTVTVVDKAKKTAYGIILLKVFDDSDLSFSVVDFNGALKIDFDGVVEYIRAVLKRVSNE